MKRLIAAFAAVVCAFAVLVTAAACAVSEYEKFSQAFDRVGEARQVVTSIQIMRGEDLLNSVTEEYTLAEEGYSVVTTTRSRNPIGAGKEFTESVTTKTVAKSDVRFGSLPSESALSDPTYSGDYVLEAKIGDPGTVGLESAAVDGNISFRAVLENGALTKIEMAYSAPSGNDVAISLSFSY